MKKTLKSRLFAGVMSGALALSLTVPALAADETVITAGYEAITIDVIVPATGTAKINPYGLPVEVTKSDNTKVSFTNQKIMTAPTAALKNKMEIDMKVDATVTGAVVDLPSSSTGTPMRLVTEALTSDVTNKSAFVYVQAKQSASTGEDDATLADKLIDEYKAWTQAYDADKDIIVKAGSESKSNFVVLKGAEMYTSTNADATHAAGSFKSYKAGSIGLIRLSGDAVATPREAWTADDKFTATIAYTITPAPAAAGGGAG